MLKQYVAVIIRRMDRTLLVKGTDGLFGPPGGHVEEGESLEDAARREVREELGRDVILFPQAHTTGYYKKPVMVCDEPDRMGIAFFAESIGPQRKLPDTSEVLEIGWFTEAEIHDLFSEGWLKHPGWNLRLLVSTLTPVELIFLEAYDNGDEPFIWRGTLEEAGCLWRNHRHLNLRGGR